jgi:hypothetical protein
MQAYNGVVANATLPASTSNHGQILRTFQTLPYIAARWRIARKGRRLAEFSHMINFFLCFCFFCSKRRPHWSLEDIAPQEKFHGSRSARYA